MKQAKMEALQWFSTNGIYLEKDADAKAETERHTPTNFGHEFAVILFSVLYLFLFGLRANLNAAITSRSSMD